MGKISTPYPTYYKQWLEFRVKTIHDFIVKVKSKVKSVNPDIKFAVYVGGGIRHITMWGLTGPVLSTTHQEHTDGLHLIIKSTVMQTISTSCS